MAEKPKEVEEIIEEWLTANGYDGLCGDNCGCGIDDLAPCGAFPGDCEPAFVHKCNSCPDKNKCEDFGKDWQCYQPVNQEENTDEPK